MAENQELPITPAQCRMARAALEWSLNDLAEAAGVGRATVQRFESGDHGVKATTVAELRKAFENRHVRFSSRRSDDFTVGLVFNPYDPDDQGDLADAWDEGYAAAGGNPEECHIVLREIPAR